MLGSEVIGFNHAPPPRVARSSPLLWPSLSTRELAGMICQLTPILSLKTIVLDSNTVFTSHD